MELLINLLHAFIHATFSLKTGFHCVYKTLLLCKENFLKNGATKLHFRVLACVADA